MLNKTNRTVSIYKYVDTSGKRSYSGTATYSNISVYIYTPEYNEAIKMMENDGAKGLYRMITEQTGIENNDKIVDNLGNNYKVLKIDTKDSGNVRTTFYQILITKIEQ